MKLYRIIATQNKEVKEVIWTGSQAEAGKARRELVTKGFKRTEVETDEVEVPTKKDELIAFLNDRQV